MSEPNYFEDENDLTRKLFNLEEILDFQSKHNVQIIRGEDYQYMCNIDGKYIGTGLTPMYALCYGIKHFKMNQNETPTKENS